MDIPNEIILHILQSLEKCDLKSVRLVSTTWGAFATELLFDRVYVSAHPENLEVFKAVTQHTLLSKCVKMLIYDAVDFVENYTKEEYVRVLWCQTWHLTRLGLRLESYEGSISEPDINTWMMLADGPGLWGRDLDEVQVACKDNEYIDYGYQKYQRYAGLQHAQFNNENFVESVNEGLQKLEALSCVVMQDRWPYPQQFSDDPKWLSLKRPTGSPLARNWNILHTEPKGWDSMLDDDGATDGAGYYRALTCALIRSHRRIQTFEVGDSGVPAQCFDRTQVKTVSFDGLDIAAFSGLKKLKLSIAPYGGEVENSVSLPNIDGLRYLLGSMLHLETLYLELPRDEDESISYTFNQVFPQQGQWSKLTTFSLCSFASSATDFLTLLIHRMPNLTKVELEDVELLTGCWEGIIECMMQSMHLLGFSIDPCAMMWHCGGTDFFGQSRCHCVWL